MQRSWRCGKTGESPYAPSVPPFRFSQSLLHALAQRRVLLLAEYLLERAADGDAIQNSTGLLGVCVWRNTSNNDAEDCRHKGESNHDQKYSG